MDLVVNLLQDKPEYAIGAVVIVLLLAVILSSGSSKKEETKKVASTSRSAGSGKKTSSQSKKSLKSKSKQTPTTTRAAAVPEKEAAAEVAVDTTSGSKKKKKKKPKTKKVAVETKSVTRAPVTSTNKNRSKDVPALDEDSDDDDDLMTACLLTSSALAKTGAAAAVAAAEEGSKKKKKKKKKPKKSPQVNSAAPANASTIVPVTGEWETVGKGAGAIVTVDSVITADGSPQPIRVNLEQEDIPVLIGPKGATIQNMQSISGAKLDINKNPSGATSTLIITADTVDSQSLALAQVQSLLSAAQEERKRATAHTVTLLPADINGGDGVKAIIGRAGATIRNIQSLTGANLNASVERGEVVITGPSLEGVNEAATLCRHAVFGEAQDVIQLESRAMVLVVYGKDYQKIRQMQNESGAKLDIEKGGTTLKISGPLEAVASAKKMVAGWVEYNKGIVFDIASEKIGAIYGKAGANIRRIQEKTGAYVEIVQEASGHKVPQCKIMGEPASVAAAKAMFQKSLDGEAIELNAGEVQLSMDLGAGTPAVIGRGGSKIAELEKTHSVKIFINSGSQGCSIVGTKENTENAKKTIEAIIKPVIDEQEMKQEADRLATSSNTPWRPLAQNGGWIAAEEESGW